MDMDTLLDTELQPLTSEEVAMYNSHDECDETVRAGVRREGKGEKKGDEDYVVVTSDGENTKCEVVTREKLEGQSEIPPSDEKDGPQDDSDEDPAPSPTPTIEWKSRADMPVRMKGAQVALHNGRVYVGGGFTGHAHTEMIVYEYDPDSNEWAELPVSPTRWFGMTEYRGQLVLVGGKDTKAKRPKLVFTNHIAVYDDENGKWIHPYPRMSATRYHPVLLTHAHLLVVAGGRRGSLDFRVEIFDGNEWSHGHTLPARGSPVTNLVHQSCWYLIEHNPFDKIYHISLDTYLQEKLATQRGEEGGEGGEGKGGEGKGGGSSEVARKPIVWGSLPLPPWEVDRIMSVGGYVLALPSLPSEAVVSSRSVHLLLEDSWVPAGKIPLISGSASVFLLPGGELMLFGGDVDGRQYSNKVYCVTVGSTADSKKTQFASPT